MAVTQPMKATTRRVLFGVNALVQAALATAVVVLIVWAGGRFKWPSAWADWTSSGVNSLSPRTLQLLKGLDQNIRITCLFAEPDRERDRIGTKRYREMQDLLALYDSAGGARVSTYIIEPTLEQARTDELLQRLVALPAYRDEARAHVVALEAFTTLNEDIKRLAAADFQRAGELVGSDDPLNQSRAFNIIRSHWQSLLEQADDMVTGINDLTGREVPRYGQAVDAVREYLPDVRLRLEDVAGWLGGDGLKTPGLTEELRAFFEQTPARYADVLARATALLADTENLKDLQLEQLHSSLTRWRSGPPVLVENEHEARVVSFWELWQPPRDGSLPVGPDGDDRMFHGEAAISSALLQLVQQDKTAVIFTYYGGESPIRPDFSRMNPMMMRQMPTAPYQRLAELLEKNNFVTAEWDVSQQPAPPATDDAGRRIYLVFPPEPPEQPNPMQPAPQAGMTPDDRQRVVDALAESGMALMLAGWLPPTSPIPGFGTPYEYAGYLKSNWGIEVLSDYLAIQFTPHPEKPGWWLPTRNQPLVIATDWTARLTDHPISKPSQADRAGFRLSCPLRLVPEDERPAGVQLAALAEVMPTADVWAVQNVQRIDEQLRVNQAVKPDAGDVAAPFPLAVAAEHEDGRKLVVFSSVEFAADAVAMASGLRQVGNAFVLGRLYPANTDIVLNALHWLTGEADRIAVGPREGDMPRLGDLDERWAARLPWFLVGIWPAAALVVGLGVWLVRRR